MSYYPPEYDKIKISRNSINKEKIHLYKGVVTLEEFKDMIGKNIFPLVIVLGKSDLNIVKQIKNDEEDNFIKDVFYIIADKYYQSKLKDDSSNFYMYLDINLLVNSFFDNNIYIDKFIAAGEKDKFVYAIYDSVWIIPVKIGLINERKHFINKKKVEIIPLSTLPEKVCVDYANSNWKYDESDVKGKGPVLVKKK